MSPGLGLSAPRTSVKKFCKHGVDLSAKGYDTFNGCLAHGMKRYYGAMIAEPQGVTIKDNSTGVFGLGSKTFELMSPLGW